MAKLIKCCKEKNCSNIFGGYESDYCEECELKRQNPSPWITVEDRLPEKSSKVLVVTSRGRNKHKPIIITWKAHYVPGSVTHWMPIPELPPLPRQ